MPAVWNWTTVFKHFSRIGNLQVEGGPESAKVQMGSMGGESTQKERIVAKEGRKLVVAACHREYGAALAFSRCRFAAAATDSWSDSGCDTLSSYNCTSNFTSWSRFPLHAPFPRSCSFHCYDHNCYNCDSMKWNAIPDAHVTGIVFSTDAVSASNVIEGGKCKLYEM